MSVSELDIWRSAKLLVNRYGDGLSVNVATVHGYIHPRTAPHLGGGARYLLFRTSVSTFLSLPA